MKRLNLSILKILAALVLALSFTGCVGYQLGSMLPDDVKTIYVPNFKNSSNEPFIISETTKAVIEELQLDGSLQIVDQADADMTLLVTLNEYELTPLVFDRSVRNRTNQFRANLYAEITVMRRGVAKPVVFNPRMSGDAVFEFAGDLTNTKRQALPKVAEDLAHDIVEKVVEAWY